MHFVLLPHLYWEGFLCSHQVRQLGQFPPVCVTLLNVVVQ